MKRLLPLGLAIVLAGCGAREAPPSAPPPSSTPSVASGPATQPPTGAGEERCEGLVGACGGWLGCVHVRTDASTPEHFVGIGENAGHFYSANHDCYGGVCNEVCTGGSLPMCRPGVTEDQGVIACSGAIAPMIAPFTCRLEGGACVQGPDPSMIPAS